MPDTTNNILNVFNETEDMACPVRADTVMAGVRLTVGICSSSTRLCLMRSCSALELIRAGIGKLTELMHIITGRLGFFFQDLMTQYPPVSPGSVVGSVFYP